MDITQSVKRYGSDNYHHLERVVNYYKSVSFDEAIESAANSQTPDENGKLRMDTHQARIGYKKSQEARALIEQRIESIANAQSWEQLFDIAEEVRSQVHKLGPLWSYDFAVRMGANLNLFPKEVYLQRGAAEGARKLLNLRGKLPRSLSLSEFPDEVVQALKEPYIIEGFLCCRKRDF